MRREKSCLRQLCRGASPSSPGRREGPCPLTSLREERRGPPQPLRAKYPSFPSSTVTRGGCLSSTVMQRGGVPVLREGNPSSSRAGEDSRRRHVSVGSWAGCGPGGSSLGTSPCPVSAPGTRQPIPAAVDDSSPGRTMAAAGSAPLPGRLTSRRRVHACAPAAVPGRPSSVLPPATRAALGAHTRQSRNQRPRPLQALRFSAHLAAPWACLCRPPSRKVLWATRWKGAASSVRGCPGAAGGPHPAPCDLSCPLTTASCCAVRP